MLSGTPSSSRSGAREPAEVGSASQASPTPSPSLSRCPGFAVKAQLSRASAILSPSSRRRRSCRRSRPRSLSLAPPGDRGHPVGRACARDLHASRDAHVGAAAYPTELGQAGRTERSRRAVGARPNRVGVGGAGDGERAILQAAQPLGRNQAGAVLPPRVADDRSSWRRRRRSDALGNQVAPGRGVPPRGTRNRRTACLAGWWCS